MQTGINAYSRMALIYRFLQTGVTQTLSKCPRQSTSLQNTWTWIKVLGFVLFGYRVWNWLIWDIGWDWVIWDIGFGIWDIWDIGFGIWVLLIRSFINT